MSLRIGPGKFSILSGRISFGPQGLLPGGRMAEISLVHGRLVWPLEGHTLSRSVL